MGSLCDKDYPNPDTTNQCSGAIGETYKLPNFCTLAGVGGDSYRETWCGKLGDGEWEVGSSSGTCNYNDCTPYQEYDVGCCNGCCGIVGTGVLCRRKAFNGDPTTCCFQDYNCTSSPALCFQSGTDLTCDPSARDITSTTCQQSVGDYCSGADLPDDDDTWLQRWVTPDGTTPAGQDWTAGQNPLERGCIYALRRNLFSFSNNPNLTCYQGSPSTIQGCNQSTGTLNSAGVIWARSLIQRVMDKYIRNGYKFGALPGEVGYNPFQDFLYREICCRYPSICGGALSSLCSAYSTQRLSLNPEAANFCGCYLPAQEYQLYTDKYQISPECTPVCNRTSNIPLTDGNGNAKHCQQNVCLIDNVAINLIQSQVQGGINIGQLCGSCTLEGGTGTCSCIIENTTIDVVNSQIGGGIDLRQNCTSTTCTTENTSGVGPAVTNIPCDGTEAYNPFPSYSNQLEASEQSNTSWKIFIAILVIALALLIIFIFIIIIRPRYAYNYQK